MINRKPFDPVPPASSRNVERGQAPYRSVADVPGLRKVVPTYGTHNGISHKHTYVGDDAHTFYSRHATEVTREGDTFGTGMVNRNTYVSSSLHRNHVSDSEKPMVMRGSARVPNPDYVQKVRVQQD